ncbi:MAG TPA: amidase, partial [Candidatus Limnocylindrales bacterium]|nr:amidase [Candidatus Limnocylindrales bacterium]
MTTITSSPVVAVEEALERIDAWDPEIRAFAHVDATGARRHAAAIERPGRERRGPLFGYALGVKDLIDTGDMPTSYGSPIFAGHRPERDAHVVQRIRRAGAVVVGKTVTTEFATFDPPPTRNPWDLACTPGGSSAGSAAAVAAGMVPAALGTQTAGSVLRPASYCGVVGFMPSSGWIGRTGIFECAPSLDRIGFLARAVDDLVPLLAATAGIDAGDPASIRQPRAQAGPALTPARVRVGVPARLLELATPAMAATVTRTADRLAQDGADVRSIAATETFEAGFAALHTVMRAEMAVVHQDLFAK